MNLFLFLKSKRGAIEKWPALGISTAAGLVFFFIVNTAANKQNEAESQVRAMSSISQSSPQAGMQRQRGMLTSIQVRDGRNQLATAEERAAMGGNSALERYNANQRALGNMEASFGRAAEFADADGGLNTGNREYTEGNTRFSVGNPNVRPTMGNGYGADGGAEDYNGSYRSGAAGSSPATLAHASMAHASGNSFGGTSGPIASAGSGAAGGNTSGATGEGARLSGSMPGGSNIVSKLGLEGANAGAGTSSFGRERDARGSGGSRNGSGKGELNDILKKSAEAAANKNASANEGGRAFLAGGKMSGGLSVDGSSTVGYGTSSDLSANTARKLKAIGNRLDKEENKQEERQRANRNLIIQLLATIAGSLGLMYAGAKILSKLLKDIDVARLMVNAAATPFARTAAIARYYALCMRYMLISVGMMAAVAVANTLLMVKASKFIHQYGASGGTGVAIVSLIAAPILTAGMVFVALKPDLVNNFINKHWAKARAGLVQWGLGKAGDIAKQAINK